jgi:ribosomal protein S18 acetylase RimI-like enzyme
MDAQAEPARRIERRATVAIWRPMLPSDIAAAHALSEVIHPGYPEDRAVFEERLRLYPDGCYVLASDDTLRGYALSHPYVTDSAPALNTVLGALPKNCDTYYFHDIAILPEARGGNAGKSIVTYLKTHARVAGFGTICLVAVNDSAPFWERHGFAAREVEGMREKLGSYGDGVVYMVQGS